MRDPWSVHRLRKLEGVLALVNTNGGPCPSRVSFKPEISGDLQHEGLYQAETLHTVRLAAWQAMRSSVEMDVNLVWDVRIRSALIR